jgi:hypothetical protein
MRYCGFFGEHSNFVFRKGETNLESSKDWVCANCVPMATMANWAYIVVPPQYKNDLGICKRLYPIHPLTWTSYRYFNAPERSR